MSVREEWRGGLLRVHRASGLHLHSDRGIQLCGVLLSVCLYPPPPPLPPIAGLLSSFSHDPSSSASSLSPSSSTISTFLLSLFPSPAFLSLSLSLLLSIYLLPSLSFFPFFLLPS